jgi:hypothetical protein
MMAQINRQGSLGMAGPLPSQQKIQQFRESTHQPGFVAAKVGGWLVGISMFRKIKPSEGQHFTRVRLPNLIGRKAEPHPI